MTHKEIEKSKGLQGKQPFPKIGDYTQLTHENITDIALALATRPNRFVLEKSLFSKKHTYILQNGLIESAIDHIIILVSPDNTVGFYKNRRIFLDDRKCINETDTTHFFESPMLANSIRDAFSLTDSFKTEYKIINKIKSWLDV